MSLGLFDRISNEIGQRAESAIKISPAVQKNLSLAKAILEGNIPGIGSEIGSRIFGPNFGLGSVLPPALGMNHDTPTPLLGGISLAEAENIFNQVSKIEYSKKNLFFIAIEDFVAIGPNFTRGTQSPANFNLFATDVGYNTITLSGDAIQLGGGSFDVLKQSERVEMRITTMDDSNGTLKKWFEERASMAVHSDATFGLPIEYLSRITVLHAFISPDVPGAKNGHVNSLVMRPGTIEYDLSRKDQGMQELQMSFVQFDTFTSL